MTRNQMIGDLMALARACNVPSGAATQIIRKYICDRNEPNYDQAAVEINALLGLRERWETGMIEQPRTRTIVTRVAGVTYEGRQAILARLHGGEPVKIEPEPTNPHDANALKVLVALDGQVFHVGYIPRELAKDVAPHLEGESMVTKVLEVTGGFERWDGEIASLGLRMSLEIPLYGGLNTEEVIRDMRDDDTDRL